MEFEYLHTERLLLRKSTIVEYNYVFNHYTNNELKAFFGITLDHELEKEKEKFYGGYVTYNRSFLFFHLIDKNTQVNMGGCGFHNWFAEHARSEIGYALLHNDYKQKGFMTEALKPIIQYGFEKMSLNRIEALVSPNNTASIKLIEKSGFSKEGYLREHYTNKGTKEDSVLYGLLKKEYYNTI